MLKPKPKPPAKRAKPPVLRTVTANRPNHVWHLDLTMVPTIGGFWISWWPFAVAATLAVLLVGRGRRRPLLPARDGEGALQEGAVGRATSTTFLDRIVPRDRPQARPPHHRPRPAVHRRRRSRVVPTSRHPATLRRHRQVRQPRRHRAVHPIAEERVHATAADRSVGAGRVRPRARLLRRLVQRGAAALAIRRSHARRDLLRKVPGVPAAAIRDPSAMAATIAVRETARARSRTTRCGDRAERRASRRAEASARRFAPTRRVRPLRFSPRSTTQLGDVCPRRRFRRDPTSTTRTSTA